MQLSNKSYLIEPSSLSFSVGFVRKRTKNPAKGQTEHSPQPSKTANQITNEESTTNQTTKQAHQERGEILVKIQPLYGKKLKTRLVSEVPLLTVVFRIILKKKDAIAVQRNKLRRRIKEAIRRETAKPLMVCKNPSWEVKTDSNGAKKPKGVSFISSGIGCIIFTQGPSYKASNQEIDDLAKKIRLQIVKKTQPQRKPSYHKTNCNPRADQQNHWTNNRPDKNKGDKKSEKGNQSANGQNEKTNKGPTRSQEHSQEHDQGQ